MAFNPKQGTDAALAQAHVIIKEFYLKQPSDYFVDYAKRLICRILLWSKAKVELRAGRSYVRLIWQATLSKTTTQNGKPLPSINMAGGITTRVDWLPLRCRTMPTKANGTWKLVTAQLGLRIGWSVKPKDSGETVEVGLDYFGGDEHLMVYPVAGDAIQV